MKYKNINIGEKYKNVSDKSVLQIYIPDRSKEYNLKRKRKTVLLFPGGGYSFTSDREAEPIALRLASYDINVFILRYVCAPFKFPNPLSDAIAALHYIYNHAHQYDVDINNIIVMGFSAGGNLAGNLIVHMNEKDRQEEIGIRKRLKIKGAIFAYPVVTTSNPNTRHNQTSINISQGREDLMEYFSFDKHIKGDFPKTFIWSTNDDNCVNIENTHSLINKLEEYNIDYESVIYDHGPHGLSLGDTFLYPEENWEYIEQFSDVKSWFFKAIDFIECL